MRQSDLTRIVVLLGAMAAPLCAQPAPSGPSEQDLAYIKQSADAFETAYQARDARAIAAMFTDEAEFVDGAGRVFHGRAAIEQEFATYFQTAAPAQIRIDMSAIRFVAPGLLTEEGVCYVYPEDGSATTSSRYVLVHARQSDDTWRIASLRSTRDLPATSHEQLKALAWLVGEWIDEGPDSVVESSWEWSEDGNFLLSRFVVKVDGDNVISGTQRLGWDPLRKRFRSWVFDTQGGFAEGIWTPVDDRWIVKVTGVRADGETASSTIEYQPVGPDALVWSARDRISGDEIQPDLTVKAVRRPPAPGASDEK